MGFPLSVCAEMLWLDRPIEWRVSRLHEMGFGIGLWNWLDHDLAKLAATGARFSIMNGFLRGGLTDAESAKAMLESVAETALVGRQLGVERLNLLGQALGAGGRPVLAVPVATGAMWLTARDTLCRMADLADRLDVTFTLENLNTLVDHPGAPFAQAEDTLALVSAVNHPRLQMNLDLYHVQIGEGNLIELCQRCLPWIGEIQVADVPGRFEPGTGEVNWPNVARALDRMGYAGPITMEAKAQGDVEAALAAFRKAFTI
ncbi:TIM barrel protein [Neogemmobacter tilapiae]|uniref:Hydroxypyruvate isomerase n=1 Tax=Neogemmobacter tilapiae TaxID=875041 RepID=A0A918TZ24_9RHOB|nr:TIM barrel protein [Gemmobacter tilapiae]GHC65262.1 hydroxypyruvate isomerase [Gemmobacter tilapiae]